MSKLDNFSRDEFEKIVKESYSMAQLGKALGYKGARVTVMDKIKEYDIDISHFKGQPWNRNNFDYSRFRKGSVISSAAALKPLTYKRGDKCQNCGKSEWLGNPIPLEIHHIDGDKLNNEESNLIILCPNCHALTVNYRGKNISNKKYVSISDIDFVNALRTSPNIRQALLKLGLTAKGGNYARARELAIKYNIEHILEP